MKFARLISASCLIAWGLLLAGHVIYTHVTAPGDYDNSVAVSVYFGALLGFCVCELLAWATRATKKTPAYKTHLQ